MNLRGDLRRPPARAEVGRTHLVRSELSGVAVGIDALRVSSIEDSEEPGPEEARTLDLARFLGFYETEPQREGETQRRAVVVRTGGRALRLIIGKVVRVEAVASDAFRPIPAFLQELAARAGIGAIFLSGDGLGYVVDVDRLGAALATEELSP